MHSVALGEISTPITKGATPTTYGFEWQASGVPFLRSECVSEKGLDMRQSMFISSAAHASLQRSQVVEGDILLTITGNIGRVVQLEGIEEANINQHIARVRVIDERLHPRYVFHYLSQRVVRRYYESITTGQAYPQISLAQVQSTSIPLISKIEQNEIVAALDDADKLINSLERLISKKQAIKQGMVQQLLSGRTRLPGFVKDWTRSIAGELGVFKGGIGFPVWAQGGKSGAYPFFKVSDMNLPGNETVMKTSNNWVSENIRRRLAATVLPAGAIVFAKVGAAVYLERKRILGIPSCVDNNMAAFIPDSTQIDNRFAYYYLLSFPLSSLVAMGALPSLNSSQLRSIPFHFPEDIEEQKAIAQILQDADQEIATLERRLESARNIKQGMMQELLTGRTRLPVEEVSA